MKSIIELRKEAIEKDINLEVLEYKMLEEKEEENERLNSIIKEVREKLNKLGEELETGEGIKWQYDRIEDILEILDKVSDKK